jgi:hypothetical protein
MFGSVFSIASSYLTCRALKGCLNRGRVEATPASADVLVRSEQIKCARPRVVSLSGKSLDIFVSLVVDSSGQVKERK